MIFLWELRELREQGSGERRRGRGEGGEQKKDKKREENRKEREINFTKLLQCVEKEEVPYHTRYSEILGGGGGRREEKGERKQCFLFYLN